MILKQLTAPGEGATPRFTSAVVAPERGMMLVQLRARPTGGDEIDVVTAPPLAQLPAKFGGPDDFAGNASFSFGGAILLPYANRIRGRVVSDSREIETEILGKRVRLPMNWGGKAPGAERYAMHGLILDRAFEVMTERDDTLAGRLQAGNFGGRWLSSADIAVAYRLTPAALELMVAVGNVGNQLMPVGIGWHPYFNLPSGDRRQARLHVPAARRLEVNNHDEVLPTGGVLPLAGTAYDFSPAGGRRLGDLYLDDCFVDLAPVSGKATATLIDPAAGYGLAVTATAPPVTAFQVYAPPDKPFVALEPQFNWTDPFGAEWRGADAGMVVLKPGERTTYAVRVALFTP
jgi:aldose 1-epimerase